MNILIGIVIGIVLTVSIIVWLWRRAERAAFRRFWMPVIFVLLILSVTGCNIFGGPKVPATTISFNPKAEVLKVSSPKDVTIQSLTVSQSPSNFTMTVTGYSSTNNSALVGMVTQAQAMIASNAAVSINNLAQQAAAGVVQGLK